MNFHLWKCTQKCVIPLCGFSQSSVNYRMRRYTVPCEFPHEEKCITPCRYTREKMYFPRRGNSPNFDFPHMRIYTYNCEFPLVEMHPKMCLSAVRIYPFLWCSTACGDTQFNVNSFTRKSVFPRTRICTVLSEFPHVEIHTSMCKSAPRKYAFPHVEIHMRSCISECGKTPHYKLLPQVQWQKIISWWRICLIEQITIQPMAASEIHSCIFSDHAASWPSAWASIVIRWTIARVTLQALKPRPVKC